MNHSAKNVVKKTVAVFLLLSSAHSVWAQTTGVDAVSAASSGQSEEKTETEQKKRGGQAKVPSAKKPVQPTKAEIDDAANRENSKSDNYEQKVRDTFLYGLESEISDQIDTLKNADDKRFVNEIYNLFQTTESNSIKEKVLVYFTALKDPCLEDYAVTVVNDPFDVKKNLVDAVFKYISAVKCSAASPALVSLMEDEHEDYIDGALSALGDVGGEEEAQFLADYLDKDDLSSGRRQELMKALGKLKATSTWAKLRDVLEDENENSYVRMYAAEALGAMGESASVEILAEQYRTVSDANLRVYLIKGLSYFKDSEAQNIILQAIRDSFYKVRLEAIESVKKQEIKAAVPFLVYRAKNDAEAVVKNACYPVIALLNTSEGNEYLVGVITDKKSGDTTKANVAAALLKEGHTGAKEIAELAIECNKNDVHKQLRYALGKEMAKYSNGDFARACTVYLESKDVSTQGTGLDMWAKGRYGECKSAVEKIADSTDGKKKPSAMALKAMRLLGRETPKD